MNAGFNLERGIKGNNRKNLIKENNSLKDYKNLFLRQLRTF